MNKDSKKREEATTSLVNTYKKDTPGQKLKTFLEFAGVSPAVMGPLDLSTIPGPSGAFRPEDTPVNPKKKTKYNQHLETKPTMPLVGH